MYYALEHINIIRLLSIDDNTDANCNYNILEDTLVSNLNKYIPIKKINLNKYRHKKSEWITTGIHKSIEYSDTVYKNMRRMPPETIEFLHVKQNLKSIIESLKGSANLNTSIFV